MKLIVKKVHFKYKNSKSISKVLIKANGGALRRQRIKIPMKNIIKTRRFN
jgi:hypothetical protein